MIKGESLAIMCIGRNETPYLEEWLEYHFSIGIDRVYYVSTDDNFSGVLSFLEESRFRSQVDVHHYYNFDRGWQTDCYNQFYPLVKEDWLLVLDIDEFLYLNQHPNVQNYLELFESSTSQIQFPWLNCISDGYCSDRVLQTSNFTNNFVFDHVKSIVRTKNVSELGIHRHELRNGKNVLSNGEDAEEKSFHNRFIKDPSFYNTNPFIMHFCTRGYYDTIIRIIDHKFKNPKGGPGQSQQLLALLLNNMNWSKVPNRFFMIKFYESLPTTDISFSLPGRHAKTDVVSLRNIFMRIINQLLDFKCKNINNLEIEFEKRFKLSQKLCATDIAINTDIDEYLQCTSQLDYIRKLRMPLRKPETPR